MSTVLYPSLSEDSWVTSPEKISDYLISTFFVAESSQTYLYKGRISSLPFLIQNNQGNVLATCVAIQDTLTEYFNRYFNNVVVDVEEVPNVEEPSKAQISMYIQFNDNTGKVYNVGRLLQYQNTTIEKIINLNNG